MSETVSREQIRRIVEEVVHEFNETLEKKIQTELGEEAPLYGSKGCLDSLNLVSFVIAVEQNLDEELGLVVSLADEKAMSQAHSPFRTCGSLIDYILSLLLQEKGSPRG